MEKPRGREVKEFSKFRPRVIPDYIAVQVIKTDGEFYHIKNPRQMKYMTLSADEYYLLEKMDGRRNFESLVRLYFERTKELASTKVKNLILQLAENGFIENSDQLWQLIPKPVKKRSLQNIFTELFRGIKIFQTGYYTAEGLFESIYTALGGLIFSPFMISLIIILSLMGILLFFNQLATTPHYLFKINDSYGLGFTFTYFLIIFLLANRAFIKGTGLKAIERSVLNLELYFLYGLFYPRTEDADSIMASRREKIFFYTGSFLSFMFPVAVAAPLLIFYEGEWNTYTQIALITTFTSLLIAYLQATPYLDSDGLRLLEEIFNISQLRLRTSTFFRKRFFLGKVELSREAYREQLIYTLVGLYGIVWLLGLGYIVYKLFNIIFYYDVIEKVYYLNPAFGDIFIFEPYTYRIFTILLLLPSILLLIFFVIYLILRFFSTIYGVFKELSIRLQSGKGIVSPFQPEMIEELKQIPLFSALSEEELKEVAKHLMVEKFPANRNIVTQGEEGDKFYTIRSGWADVIYEEKSGLEHVVAELGPGDCFGEIALIENVKRTATVRSKTEIELISLDKETFRKYFVETFGTGEKITFIIRTSQFLRKMPLFSDFSSRELLEIVSKMQPMEVSAGTTIIKQGDIGDKFYLLQEGEVEVIFEQITDEGYREIKLAELGPGSFFGEIALLKNVPRTATVRAKTDCRLLWLDKENFLTIFKKHLGAISEMMKLSEQRLKEQEKVKKANQEKEKE